MDASDFKNEMDRIKKIYTEAWSENWGAVPLTEEEFDRIVGEFKLIYDKDLSFIAEYDGKPAGLSLVLPDMNQALKKAGGRLFPLGLLKILWHKRKISSWRVPVMGVLEEHRMRGIEAVFCCRTYDAAKKNRTYRKCELSWVLESNTAANAVLKKMGARGRKPTGFMKSSFSGKKAARKARVRKRIFFICGSMNQTTQMHQISTHLREYDHSFSPYYCDGPVEILRRLGLIEFTIAGNKLAGRCRKYLQTHGLPSTTRGRIGPTIWWLPARTCSFRGTFGATGSCWFRRGLQTRNPWCFILSSASDSFRSGWRAHRRRVSAMPTKLSASRARGTATSSSGKACTREDRGDGDTQFR